jgi:hypothetical protein
MLKKNSTKRNSLAGKHPSYDKLGMSEARRKKKLAYDKAYEASPSRVNYREELNKANRRARKAGIEKFGDGKDMSHTKSGKLTREPQKTNRARNGQNGKSSKK